MFSVTPGWKGILFYRVSLKGFCKFGGNANFYDLLTPWDFIDKYGIDHVTVVEEKYGLYVMGDIILTDVWDIGGW